MTALNVNSATTTAMHIKEEGGGGNETNWNDRHHGIWVGWDAKFSHNNVHTHSSNVASHFPVALVRIN